jgi:hypothetical protein
LDSPRQCFSFLLVFGRLCVGRSEALHIWYGRCEMGAISASMQRDVYYYDRMEKNQDMIFNVLFAGWTYD